MIKVKTIPEYARHKSVTVQTVYQWIKEGKLKTRKVLGKQVIEI
jgi:predicted site-specific integrase-resolvase